MRRPTACLALACCALVLAPPIGASTSRNAARAQASYKAMQRFFYRKEARLYAPAYPGIARLPYSHLWPFSQALAATVAMAQLPDGGARYRPALSDRLRALKRYWNASRRPAGYDAEPLTYPGGGDQFYDDNAWVGLELVTVSRRFGDGKALARAQQLFRLLLAGWDRTTTHPCPGGVFWSRTPPLRDRNTVSTANAAQLGLQLYAVTRNPRFLRWATVMYGWVQRCLGAPNGLYWDHIDAGGRIDRKQWSYNQGAMIGAAVLLYQATRDPQYLVEAEFAADAAVASYRPFETGSEPAYFLGIFFHNLAQLRAIEPASSYEDAIEAYADSVWTRARDPATGLFHFAGAKRVQVLEQAAMVRIYAELATVPQASGAGSDDCDSWQPAQRNGDVPGLIFASCAAKPSSRSSMPDTDSR